jgi:hypothetical protein
MADDYVGDLKKARDELVRQRRLIISALNKNYNDDTEHQVTALTRYQQAIEAIDNAVMMSNVQPKSPLVCSHEPLLYDTKIEGPVCLV